MRLNAIAAACALALMTAPVYAEGDQKPTEDQARHTQEMHDQGMTHEDHEGMMEEQDAMSFEEDAGERQDIVHEGDVDELDADDQAEELADAQEQLNEAITVLQDMKADPELTAALSQAKGVFVVPDYAAAALIIGGSGGEGVLLTNNGQWGTPVFYDVGSVSFGAQAGVEAGAIAMLLMSDEAIESFHQENNFSLDAKAGLSIIDWSARAEGSVGKGDVIVYSDTEGLFAQASIAVSDINFDDEENQAYYNQQTTAQAILNGEVKNPHEQDLTDALAQITG